MKRELLEKAVSGYYEALHARDLEAWLGVLDEEIVSHSPVGGPVIEGHDGMRLAFKTVMGTLQSVEFDTGELFGGGNAAAVKWVARGSGHNGQSVTFEGINIFSITLEGKIQRIDSYWDPNELMRQLNR